MWVAVLVPVSSIALSAPLGIAAQDYRDIAREAGLVVVTGTGGAEKNHIAEYGSSTGQDPNSCMNAYQRLQADRPHMFRLQAVLFLPYDTVLAVNGNVESGKPFSRQVRAAGVTTQPAQNFIVENAGSREGLRHPTLWVADVRLGKRFDLGDVQLKLDAYVYNALNSTASIGHASLRLEDPGEQFIPSSWVEPRRLMLLAGFVF